MLRTVRALAAVAIVGGALAALSIAGHATAPSAKLLIQSNARLVSPNEVVVSVKYSCMGASPFDYGQLSISEPAHAASGERSVPGQGFGDFTPVCDDKTHSADVHVFGGPWHRGDAAAAGIVAGLSNYANATAEIQIK
jgi:hypothetical protein